MLIYVYEYVCAGCVGMCSSMDTAFIKYKYEILNSMPGVDKMAQQLNSLSHRIIILFSKSHHGFFIETITTSFIVSYE